MNDLINLLTSKEIIIVYIVAGVACFLYFIIYLIDKSYYKRKQKQNIMTWILCKEHFDLFSFG